MKRKIMLMASLIVVVAFSATAGDNAGNNWYLIVGETSNDNAKGFDNYSAWSSDGKATGIKPEAFSLDDTYIVRANAYRLRVENNGNEERRFSGGTIQLGESGNHGALMLYATSAKKIGVPRIVLKNGCIYAAANGEFVLDSDINVETANSKSTHITFHNSYENQRLRLEGKLSSTAGAVLAMGLTNVFQTVISSKLNDVLEVASDCSGYMGTLSVSTYFGAQLLDKKVLFGTTTFPGTMSFAQNCALGTLSAADELKVAKLSMADKSWLIVPVENGVAGMITVTNLFSASGEVLVSAPVLADADKRVPIFFLSRGCRKQQSQIRFGSEFYAKTCTRKR